jgi:predicted Zn-dependent protease
MILPESEARKLLEKVLSYSKADSCSLHLTGNNNYNLRFAVNSLSTNGYEDGLSVSITSNFGRRSGSVSLNRFDDNDIRDAVKLAEAIARISPENNEFVSPLRPQTYLKGNNYFKATEDFDAGTRANAVGRMIEKSGKNDVVAAGYVGNGAEFSAVMNSNGLFAYNLGSSVVFSSTVRTKDGTGSSKVMKDYVDVNNLDFDKLSDRVISKCISSAHPVELRPGKYTVVLEPAATADLIANLGYFMDARSADEGRSFFSRKGGGNVIGDKICNSNVNIYSDPTDPNAPSITFSGEGLPRTNIKWIEDGVLRNLMRERFWAEKTSQPAIPFPSNVIMKGAETSLEEMIAGTDYAILVTRFWYIRTVDPQTILLTGLTRDGVFEIIDGKISRPIKNFRFNESPINVLNNVVQIGKAEKASGSETGWLQLFVPPLKVKDFNFSSLSDAI